MKWQLLDQTHLIAIFNAPTPEVILGSDILKLTPANIMAHTYCLDEDQWKKAIAPVIPSTFIGPPTNCNRTDESNSPHHPNYINHCYNQRYTIQEVNPHTYYPTYYRR